MRAKQIAQPARNVPLLSWASQKPLHPQALFLALLPVLADLKKEKHGATQEPFHSNYRNVCGERSLWVCFKILQFNNNKKNNFRGRGTKGNKAKTLVILEMGSEYMDTMLSTFALI